MEASLFLCALSWFDLISWNLVLVTLMKLVKASSSADGFVYGCCWDG